MPAITYNLSIPDSPNNPSVDQPNMKVNTNAINTLVAVDHYTFADSAAGNHKQVTFAGKNTPAAQTDPVSVLYTQSGTASTRADLAFVNQNATYVLSTLRAVGSFVTITSNGAVTPVTSFNVSSITSSSSGTVYTIAIPAGGVTGTSVAVFLNNSVSTAEIGWSYSANTLVITADSAAGRTISFQIHQV